MGPHIIDDTLEHLSNADVLNDNNKHISLSERIEWEYKEWDTGDKMEIKYVPVNYSIPEITEDNPTPNTLYEHMQAIDKRISELETDLAIKMTTI